MDAPVLLCADGSELSTEALRAGLDLVRPDLPRQASAMLDDPRNPWNTYRHEGLPPTPVCNPGGAALEAALAPLASDDLYFVARGDGRSAFAATLDAHRRNVRELLRPRPRPPGGAR